jgi:hypothetical protein
MNASTAPHKNREDLEDLNATMLAVGTAGIVCVSVMERSPTTHRVTRGPAKSVQGNAGLTGISINNTKADNT